ncbi:DNA-binding transcriptional regulator [soil metagenome]
MAKNSKQRKRAVEPQSRPSRAPIIAARRVRHVALIVDTAVAPRRQMLRGVAQYIQEHEPWAVYLKPEGVAKALGDWLLHWEGDGIIAAVHEPDNPLLKQRGLPVVDVAGAITLPGVPLVHANDFSIGRVGAEHLLERGFRQFGFLEQPDKYWSVRRRDGFISAVKQKGFTCDVFGVEPLAGAGGPMSFEQQQTALVNWIEALPKPIGVMTSTDLMGQQFLEACLRAGVSVPEQIAVIGADNDQPICLIAWPALSSVIINDKLRGYKAAAVLDDMIAGRPVPKEPIYIEPAGVARRASTDILAIDDELISRALKFIRDRACDGIDVPEVVRQVPLSRSVLERRFRNLLGRTVNEEIVRLRLNKAIEMLSSTALELKAIAGRCGFRSQAYMTAVFRRKLGLTPGSYRKPAAQPKLTRGMNDR